MNSGYVFWPSDLNVNKNIPDQKNFEIKTNYSWEIYFKELLFLWQINNRIQAFFTNLSLGK